MSELQNISSCIEGLDEILGSFRTPSTILVAGTAGVGKTTMALQMLSNAAKNGEKVLYVPLTTATSDKIKNLQSVYPFLSESISIYPVSRQAAEKDPLSTLIDMGNVITSEAPDRIVIDPITPIGFGFVEQERRRFFYTLDSMLKESNSLVILTGELLEEQIHSSVVSHLTDGIIYLSKDNSGYHTAHKLRILKMLGNDIQKRGQCIAKEYSYDVSSEGFIAYPRLSCSVSTSISENKIRSGMDNFDLMLYGGIIAGNSMLVAGEPGAGKTIFAWKFMMEGLENGENGIIVSYGEEPAQIISEALKFGWDMQQYVNSDKLHFIYSNPEELYSAEHAINIKKQVESSNITRIVVDGLVNLEITFPDDVKLRGYLLSLVNYLKKEGVSSVFTTELDPQTGAIKSNDASFIMDTVVTLRQILCSNEVKRYLRILKSKGSRHGLTMREYVITDDGMKLQCDVLP